jgi:hypothetical protein
LPIRSKRDESNILAANLDSRSAARRALGATNNQGQSGLIIAMNIGVNIANAQSPNDCWHTLRGLLHNGPLCGNGWNMPLLGQG